MKLDTLPLSPLESKQIASATEDRPRSESAASLLETINLECVRDDRVLFSDLNFQIRPGQVVQVEGHNGSGKTSLLRILCGLSLPNEGEVRWCGQSIQDVRPEFLGSLTYLGHHNGIKGELSPLENLLFASSLSPNGATIDPYALLSRFALKGFEDVPCRTLSAGQNRRAGLARLLITRSELWVLDEPFTALDRKGMADLEGIFEEHVKSGGMLILTTHHPINMGDCQVQYLNLSERGEGM